MNCLVILRFLVHGTEGAEELLLNMDLDYARFWKLYKHFA